MPTTGGEARGTGGQTQVSIEMILGQWEILGKWTNFDLEKNHIESFIADQLNICILHLVHIVQSS